VAQSRGFETGHAVPQGRDAGSLGSAWSSARGGMPSPGLTVECPGMLRMHRKKVPSARRTDLRLCCSRQALCSHTLSTRAGRIVKCHDLFGICQILE